MAERREIATFHARRGRLSPRRQADADRLWPRFGLDLAEADPTDAVARILANGLIIDFGCGQGDTALALAQSHPDAHVLAVEVHLPSIVTLLRRIEAADLGNITVARGDGISLLRTAVPSGSLRGFVAMFPDPWPKARHHKRRLWRPDLTDLVADRLCDGGWIHTATDVGDYAHQMERVLGGHPRLRRVDHDPSSLPWRVVTYYESKARREGKTIWDVHLAVAPDGM